MPVKVTRLRRSRAWLLAKQKPALGFYMFNLWVAAWHEVPAASLEDDDVVLCDAALCAPKEWPKVKEIVMRRWVRCSDGRLYHPIVAEIALESWEKKLSQRGRTKNATEARRNRNGQRNGNVPRDRNDDVTFTKGEGEREGQGQGEGRDHVERNDCTNELLTDLHRNLKLGDPGAFVFERKRDINRLLDAGLREAELLESAQVCLARGKSSWGYFIKAAEGRHRDANGNGVANGHALPQTSQRTRSDGDWRKIIQWFRASGQWHESYPAVAEIAQFGASTETQTMAIEIAAKFARGEIRPLEPDQLSAMGRA